MYSKLSCAESSQNGDQSVRKENALSASQNLCFSYRAMCGFCLHTRLGYAEGQPAIISRLTCAL